MNARLRANVLRLRPDKEPAPMTRIPRTPVVLTPIAWGKRDSKLGRAVCQHVVDTTPPMSIPFVLGLSRRLRHFLAHYGIRA
jgi:hypothetical protein